MTEERDELLGRVVGELRALPKADERAIARIVAQARATPQDAPDGRAHEAPEVAPERGYAITAWWSRRPRLSMGSAAAMALAAGLVGFLVRDAVPTRDAGPTAPPPVEMAAAARRGGTPTVAVAATDAAVPLRPTQFVLDAPGAREVTLVGDFNEWHPDSTKLVRDPATGIWTVTLPLTPGRHVYTFLVDGVRTTDPRAPKAYDAALGVTTSVTIVGVPGGM